MLLSSSLHYRACLYDCMPTYMLKFCIVWWWRLILLRADFPWKPLSFFLLKREIRLHSIMPLSSVSDLKNVSGSLLRTTSGNMSSKKSHAAEHLCLCQNTSMQWFLPKSKHDILFDNEDTSSRDFISSRSAVSWRGPSSSRSSSSTWKLALCVLLITFIPNAFPPWELHVRILDKIVWKMCECEFLRYWSQSHN